MVSKGLSPSSHFPVGFRLPVDSASHGAARHAWRTSGRRESCLSRPAHTTVRTGPYTAVQVLRCRAPELSKKVEETPLRE